MNFFHHEPVRVPPVAVGEAVEVADQNVLGLEFIFLLKKVGSMRYVPFYFYLKTIAHQFRIRDDDEPLREGIAAVESAVLAADGVILLP